MKNRPFNPDRHVRKKGVWLDDVGPVVVHAGDAVFVNGIEGSAGRRLNKAFAGAGQYVYPLDIPDPHPDFEKPATADQFHELLGTISKWNFEVGPFAGRIMVGWIVNALLCGIVPWRAHLLLSGAPGTGKSTLLELIMAVFGPDGIVSSDDATEAGIRQLLNGARKAVALDEIENENDANNYKVRQVVKLARNASKARVGGGTLRGSAEGHAKDWPIVTTIVFSSVDAIPLRPQDRTRITPLRLRPVPPDQAEFARIEAAIAEIRTRGPSFRSRVCTIEFFDRYKINLRVFQDTLAAIKCSPRLCDQLGAFLAGSETALNDMPIDRTSADAIVEECIMNGFGDEASQMGGEEECLARLLLSRAKVFSDSTSGSVEMTLGELVGLAYRSDSDSYKRALRTYGLGWYQDADGNWYLCVGERGAELDRIFAGTRWSEGGWTESLGRLGRAHRYRRMTFLGSIKQRATWIEASAVVEPELLEEKDRKAAEENKAKTRRNQGVDKAEGM